MTVTYKENMTDQDQLQKDMQDLVRKLRRQYGHFEFINVVEPQGRGAWHSHVFTIFEGKAPFMNQKTIESNLWQKGSVKITKIDAIDNLGAYLTAYLGNIPIEQANDEQRSNFEEIKAQGKKYLKGARLSMYPANFNIIRKSKNIKKPIVRFTSDSEEIENAQQGKMTFTKIYEIQNDSKEIIKTYKKSFYNSSPANLINQE